MPFVHIYVIARTAIVVEIVMATEIGFLFRGFEVVLGIGILRLEISKDFFLFIVQGFAIFVCKVESIPEPLRNNDGVHEVEMTFVLDP